MSATKANKLHAISSGVLAESLQPSNTPSWVVPVERATAFVRARTPTDVRRSTSLVVINPDRPYRDMHRTQRVKLRTPNQRPAVRRRVGIDGQYRSNPTLIPATPAIEGETPEGRRACLFTNVSGDAHRTCAIARKAPTRETVVGHVRRERSTSRATCLRERARTALLRATRQRSGVAAEHCNPRSAITAA